MSTNQAMDIKENIDDSESIASDDSDEMTGRCNQTISAKKQSHYYNY